MNELTTNIPASSLPSPRCPVAVRPATLDDLPFIDALQKKHSKQVGFMQTKALEGKIKLGHVIIAEDQTNQRVGYCIGNDQYYKRDDLGVIFQLSVVPEKRRSLIGATLVKAMFDRAAYGCRLFCCWCAQDIEANRFWESLGFVPLAFRAGSKSKDRVHIFWQKRIREGDTQTPWWFPSKTAGGALGEERLVLPIPPDKRWNDEMPRVLPGEEVKKLEEGGAKPSRGSKSKNKNGPPPVPSTSIATGALRMVLPKRPAPAAKSKREPRVKQKHDPAHVARARELRDRYLEHVNTGQLELASAGKYDISRALPEPTNVKIGPKLIAAA